MSHEIETHGTQAAAVFARKDAWHRLGTTVRDRAFTAEEAMRLGHLGGWDVRKLPLTTAEVSEGGVRQHPPAGELSVSASALAASRLAAQPQRPIVATALALPLHPEI